MEENKKILDNIVQKYTVEVYNDCNEFINLLYLSNFDCTRTRKLLEIIIKNNGSTDIYLLKYLLPNIPQSEIDKIVSNLCYETLISEELIRSGVELLIEVFVNCNSCSSNDVSDNFNDLGESYYFGKEIPQDYIKAFECFLKASKDNNPTAQCNIGMCYEKGNGVSRNYEKAVEWYTKSAEQGYAEAEFRLAFCYDNGNGVKQDYKKAVEWYTKSANQNHAYAQCNLGDCYFEGRGIAKSVLNARHWYYEASKRGVTRANAYLRGNF